MSQAKSGQKAVVLLSGGLDSSTVLAIALSENNSVSALSFDYGQRHSVELAAAATVARANGIDRHLTIMMDLRQFGGSALTAEIDVPKDRDMSGLDDGIIPVTYVPARNTIFLSFALALAEVDGAGRIYIGVNALDYSGYPDCRPEYLAAFQTMASLATRAGVEGANIEIRTPLLHLSKSEIIRMGTGLGVDYSLTTSCYDPAANGACGRCDACQLRLRGFADAGLTDPITYRD